MIRLRGNYASITELRGLLAHLETSGGDAETIAIVRACLRMRGVSEAMNGGAR